MRVTYQGHDSASSCSPSQRDALDPPPWPSEVDKEVDRVVMHNSAFEPNRNDQDESKDKQQARETPFRSCVFGELSCFLQPEPAAEEADHSNGGEQFRKGWKWVAGRPQERHTRAENDRSEELHRCLFDARRHKLHPSAKIQDIGRGYLRIAR